MARSSAALVWAGYLKSLERRPLSTKALTSAVLRTLAVLISQTILGLKNYDWKQVQKYLIYTIFFDLPVLEPWYTWGGLNALTRAVRLHLLESKSKRLFVLVQAMLDQLTYGIAYNAYFFVCFGFLGGKSLSLSCRDMLQVIGPTTRDSFSFWIPATYGLLSMPVNLQLPTMSLAGFFWALCLAMKQKMHETKAVADKQRS
mmetsp:Transcript_5154/g.9372  ORF Transcript_5154/g.9372 Transcript_5154/m.9372 type:complete len:201 (+) Transcript_5154:79-681(+)